MDQKAVAQPENETKVPTLLTDTSVEVVDEVTRTAKVSIEAGKVQTAFDSRIAELMKTVRLKGFRPGKAPRNMVEKLYGERARFEVADKLVNEALNEIVKANELNLVGQPSVDLTTYEQGEQLEFTATMSLYPAPTIEGYEGLAVEVEKVSTSDEELEKALQEYQSSRATFKEIEGRTKAEAGDVIDATVVTLINDEEQGAGEPLVVALGEGNLPEEVEEGMLGVAIGETKQIDIAPQKNDETEADAEPAPERKVSYKMTLNKLSEKVLPELDDEFVKSLAIKDVETVDALRDSTKERLVAQAEDQQKAATTEKLLLALLDKNEFLVPQALIDEEIRAMIAQSGMIDPQKVNVRELDVERFRDQLGETAEKRVKMSVIVDRVAEKEDLFAKKDDIDGFVQETADKYKMDVATVKQYMLGQQQVMNTMMEITRNKVLAFLQEKAEIKLVEASE